MIRINFAFQAWVHIDYNSMYRQVEVASNSPALTVWSLVQVI